MYPFTDARLYSTSTQSLTRDSPPAFTSSLSGYYPHFAFSSLPQFQSHLPPYLSPRVPPPSPTVNYLPFSASLISTSSVSPTSSTQTVPSIVSSTTNTKVYYSNKRKEYEAREKSNQKASSTDKFTCPICHEGELTAFDLTKHFQFELEKFHRQESRKAQSSSNIDIESVDDDDDVFSGRETASHLSPSPGSSVHERLEKFRLIRRNRSHRQSRSYSIGWIKDDDFTSTTSPLGYNLMNSGEPAAPFHGGIEPLAFYRSSSVEEVKRCRLSLASTSSSSSSSSVTGSNTSRASSPTRDDSPHPK